ncbi:receptor-type tyrosine-protein phosphatase eta [Hemicordylus capensis]|uniref:receptor-type tyrosine-protein phosphatase eta n=1 Tax=Hemicordylus capensis TaxID=884348 RepID=UPI002302F7A9|nr:receptor-type tyrosine-protein phosphatase eta [Hemicordylus capensis]
MRRLALLFLLPLLWLGKIKVAAGCDGCSLVFNSTETEIHIQLPSNISIHNVTAIDGTLATFNRTNLIPGLISGLKPGIQYIVYIQSSNGTCCENITTVPSPVDYISIDSIDTTAVSLSWNNSDPNAASYTYKIYITGYGSPRVETSESNSTVISGLQPGTLYTFAIYPVASDNKTEGNPKNISIYTVPSPVDYISIDSIDTTAVSLSWNNNDPNAASYTYKIYITGYGIPREETSEANSTVISGLQPGTLYTFAIYPVASDNKTEGNPKNISIYTVPSPVDYISIDSINTTAVSLSWNNNDPNAASYTYKIYITGYGIPREETSKANSTVISGLHPGTLYTFAIYPVAGDDKTEGNPKNISIYTVPSPVDYISIDSINTTAVSLSWNNSDPNATGYTYKIYITGDGNPRNETSEANSTVISGLQPGTLYTFAIYPVAGDGKTEGNPKNISIYTEPSPVSFFHIENISTTAVDLWWNSSDSNAASYTYRILIETGNSNNTKNPNSTTARISDLDPGTSYKFTIYPVAGDGTTEGKPMYGTCYTKPSPVSFFHIGNISTTAVGLWWNSSDSNAASYTYRVLIETGNSSKTKKFDTTTAEIDNLEPGTPYTFTVYPVAGDGTTVGGPKYETGYTYPASVGSLDCKEVAKKPHLVLNWSTPAGMFHSFSIKIFNSTWRDTQNCSLEERNTTFTNLSYFTTYNVSIVTHSFTKESLPQEINCQTSIGDPPPPSNAPSVKATSHNSLKVQFSNFDSANGPITAYAVIISTSTDINYDESFNYTYHDFINKKTNAYVAFVILEQKRSSSSSNSRDFDIEVGDGSTTNGYVNGKLAPLGSYRACVAGFTHIVFINETTGPINVRRSYVSYSPFSDVVVLPQNPAVIIGAVVGCILGVAVIAAVLALIFWRKRRKGGNDGLVFTSIESKLLKVENFESYFKKQKADSNCGFAEEYEDLRPVGVNQPKFAAELTENKAKNRYNNVLPYDISRVKLSIENHPTNDYINANYMPGYNSKKEFIAAQGPLPNTVQDFWRMIWEKNIYTVVMLTKCIEQGRTKCEEYWPDKQSKTYGEITVAMTSEIFLPEWTIRDFSMKKSNSSESHPVRQFHFTAWPDHGVPETTDLLISFRHLVQDYMKQKPQTSPTLVHCSAGVGRTGTFIAIDRLIHQMEMENTVDVYGVVYDLRMHRSLMVQTEDQYIFLNQCVLDIIKSQKEKKMDLIYQNTNAMAIYENFTPSPHPGKANGYHA